jgi:hypothetical protein
MNFTAAAFGRCALRKRPGIPGLFGVIETSFVEYHVELDYHSNIGQNSTAVPEKTIRFEIALFGNDNQSVVIHGAIDPVLDHRGDMERNLAAETNLDGGKIPILLVEITSFGSPGIGPGGGPSVP